MKLLGPRGWNSLVNYGLLLLNVHCTKILILKGKILPFCRIPSSAKFFSFFSIAYTISKARTILSNRTFLCFDWFSCQSWSTGKSWILVTVTNWLWSYVKWSAVWLNLNVSQKRTNSFFNKQRFLFLCCYFLLLLEPKAGEQDELRATALLNSTAIENEVIYVCRWSGSRAAGAS